jgi:hypothetical protein
MLRKRGLTRGAGPEHNIIQNPALSRSIQQLTGTRQAHVAPVMGDTVQPVVIADDVRDYPAAARPQTCAAFASVNGDGINPTAGIMLINPSASNVILRMLQLSVYAQTVAGDISWALSDTDTLGLGLAPGYSAQGVRLNAGTPPVGRTDLPVGSPVSPNGTGGLRRRFGGVVSPYIWSKPNGWTEDEVIFAERKIHLDLLPRGVFVVEVIDTNAVYYANFIWQEIPL